MIGAGAMHESPCKQLMYPTFCFAVQVSFCLLFSPSGLVIALLCGPWHLVNQLPAHRGRQAVGMRAIASRWISGKHMRPPANASLLMCLPSFAHLSSSCSLDCESSHYKSI